MRRIAMSLVVGLAIAVAVAPVVWRSVYAVHPPLCSWASNYGDFCVEWNPELGRYNPPPDGIPADFSRPDPFRDAPQDPLVPAAMIFMVSTGLTWLTLTAIGRLALLLRRPPRGPGSDRATT
jgi:hypothetical protein